MVNWWKSSIEEQGGEQAGALVSNTNLLINWYFPNPINQRVVTSWSNGYGIDRWYITNSGTGKAELVAGGIQLSAVGGNFRFDQIFSPEDIEDDSTLTFSIMPLEKFSGNIQLVIMGYNKKDGVWTSFGLATYSGGIAGQPLSVTAKNIDRELYQESIRVRILLFDGTSLKIAAAKLELGDTQTLAHQENDKWVLNDPPPNKALELLKCQRYFRRMKSPNTDTNICAAIGFCSTATNIVVPLSLGTELRTRPTVSYSSLNDIQFQVNNAAKTVNPTNVTAIYPVGDVIDLHFTVPNVDIGPAIMRIVNAGYIDLDANL